MDRKEAVAVADERTVVRLSPLHNVVFACIFDNEKKSGIAMLDLLAGSRL